ncbi:hypothetical protein [Ornithinibacillus xuwenensis]|uniref:DUF3278 domain-containing protein n=1 Tax=Ornithinibacillus xuwenensis TaxID=3144668 RepID=A0ABU9XCQ0_9BACI
MNLNDFEYGGRLEIFKITKRGMFSKTTDNKNMKEMYNILLEEDYNTLRVLRAILSAENERFKHFAPKSAMITLILTTFFAIIAMYVLASVNLGTHVLTKAIDMEINDMEELYGETNLYLEMFQSSRFFEENFDKEFIDNFDQLSDSLYFNNLKDHLSLFGAVVIIIGIYYLWHYIRYSRSLKLKFLLDEVIEMKVNIDSKDNE